MKKAQLVNQQQLKDLKFIKQAFQKLSNFKQHEINKFIVYIQQNHPLRVYLTKKLEEDKIYSQINSFVQSIVKGNKQQTKIHLFSLPKREQEIFQPLIQYQLQQNKIINQKKRPEIVEKNKFLTNNPQGLKKQLIFTKLKTQEDYKRQLQEIIQKLQEERLKNQLQIAQERMKFSKISKLYAPKIFFNKKSMIEESGQYEFVISLFNPKIIDFTKNISTLCFPYGKQFLSKTYQLERLLYVVKTKENTIIGGYAQSYHGKYRKNDFIFIINQNLSQYFIGNKKQAKGLADSSENCIRFGFNDINISLNGLTSKYPIIRCQRFGTPQGYFNVEGKNWENLFSKESKRQLEVKEIQIHQVIFKE